MPAAGAGWGERACRGFARVRSRRSYRSPLAREGGVRVRSGLVGGCWLSRARHLAPLPLAERGWGEGRRGPCEAVAASARDRFSLQNQHHDSLPTLSRFHGDDLTVPAAGEGTSRSLFRLQRDQRILDGDRVASLHPHLDYGHRRNRRCPEPDSIVAMPGRP